MRIEDIPLIPVEPSSIGALRLVLKPLPGGSALLVVCNENEETSDAGNPVGFIKCLDNESKLTFK